MPTKQITVCCNCGKTSCDGGMWKITKVIRKATGEDTTAKTHPSHLLNCTLHWFGCVKWDNYKMKDVRNKPVGTIFNKTFNNWVEKSIVELTKVEM